MKKDKILREALYELLASINPHAGNQSFETMYAELLIGFDVPLSRFTYSKSHPNDDSIKKAIIALKHFDSYAPNVKNTPKRKSPIFEIDDTLLIVSVDFNGEELEYSWHRDPKGFQSMIVAFFTPKEEMNILEGKPRLVVSAKRAKEFINKYNYNRNSKFTQQ